MIISKITINELREIETIKLKINDCLVDYLNKEEGVSVKDTPSSFILRNIGINILIYKLKCYNYGNGKDLSNYM